MAQNNQAVAYGFGQNGSAFLDSDEQDFYAPHGLVIVAIQMVTNTAFSTLEAETKSIPTYGGSTTHIHRVTPEYFGSEVAAHNLGDCVITGASSSGGTTVNHSINTAGYNGGSAIKVGMQVVSLTDNDYPRDGLLGKPVTITSITDVNNFEVSDNAVLTTLNSQSLAGLELHSSGYGGFATSSGDIFPAGMTIVGRWVKVGLQTDSHTSPKVVVYFGK